MGDGPATGRGKKCDQLFLDTHHFPCKEAWQLLCEQEGGGGMGGKRNEFG